MMVILITVRTNSRLCEYAGSCAIEDVSTGSDFINVVAGSSNSFEFEALIC